MNNKKTIAAMYYVTICSILILISITFNGTYSFFVASVVDNNADGRTANITAGSVSGISLNETVKIEPIKNMIPNDSITKTFVLNNPDNVSGTVSLEWQDVVNNLGNKKDLIIILKNVTENKDVITEAQKKQFPSASGELLLENVEVKASSSITYSLTIKYLNDPDNNQMTGDENKSFGATIKIKS